MLSWTTCNQPGRSRRERHSRPGRSSSSRSKDGSRPTWPSARPTGSDGTSGRTRNRKPPERRGPEPEHKPRERRAPGPERKPWGLRSRPGRSSSSRSNDGRRPAEPSVPQAGSDGTSGRTRNRKPPERRGPEPGRRAAGAQGAGAAQQAGAQQLFSQQEWQEASLAFSRSKRQGRQLFGTQPQAGSQHLGAAQAAGRRAPEPGHKPPERKAPEPHSRPGRSSSSRSSRPFWPSTVRRGRDGSSSERRPRYNRRPAHKPWVLRSTWGLRTHRKDQQTSWPMRCSRWPRRSKRRGPPPTEGNDASWELLLVIKTQWENNATSVNRGFGSDLAMLSTKEPAVF